MTKYSCERCMKEFSQKSHYVKHMKKKRPCQDNKSKIEAVVENLINKKLISKKFQNKIISMEIISELDNKYQITDNIQLFINDANNIVPKFSKQIDLIYMDPPYDTNRNFTLTSAKKKKEVGTTAIQNVGFSDKWEKNNYENWLNIFINNLKTTLTPIGSLVIHISSENSFIIEKILREHFKNIEKVYWKRCHGKNTVKKKLGAVIDILFIAYNKKRIFNQQFVPIEENSVWAFKNKDKRGSYSLGGLRHDRTRKGHMYTILQGGVEYKNK